MEKQWDKQLLLYKATGRDLFRKKTLRRNPKAMK